MRRLSVTIFSLALAVGVLFSFNNLPRAEALTVSSPRDCDNNAVMRCGALSTRELQQKYHGSGVVGIFNHFGIAPTDMNMIESTAVAGQVTCDGRVLVGGNVVATNAVTAGRQNMAGSTPVKAGGVTFYKRPTSVSFASCPLAAFVVMKNNQFAFAILASCGNPVTAVPVKRAAPTPPAPPPAPSPTPTPTPPPAPQVQAVVTPPPPPPQQIVKTGPEDVVGLGLLATIGGTVAHYLYQRRLSREN